MCQVFGIETEQIRLSANMGNVEDGLPGEMFKSRKKNSSTAGKAIYWKRMSRNLLCRQSLLFRMNMNLQEMQCVLWKETYNEEFYKARSTILRMLIKRSSSERPTGQGGYGMSTICIN